MAAARQLEIVGSDIIDDELAEMPDHERREKVGLLLTVISTQISLTNGIERRAVQLQKWGLMPLDALHLATVESARADYFLTTDDNLLRKATRHQPDLKVKVENPAKWIIQEATDES
jgi:predicted nucleic acid-binding protein